MARKAPWFCLALILAGCSSSHDKVSASDLALIQNSLTTDGFRQFLGDPPPGTTVGCADRVLGADHDGSRVYLDIACGAWQRPHCGPSDGPNGSFPVVATVHEDRSVTWQEPGDGPDYAPTIRRLFPRSLWSAALHRTDESALVASAMRHAGC